MFFDSFFISSLCFMWMNCVLSGQQAKFNWKQRRNNRNCNQKCDIRLGSFLNWVCIKRFSLCVRTLRTFSMVALRRSFGCWYRPYIPYVRLVYGFSVSDRRFASQHESVMTSETYIHNTYICILFYNIDEKSRTHLRRVCAFVCVSVCVCVRMLACLC